MRTPRLQPKRSRLWLDDGSCIRLKPEYPNHVWSYDFVEDRTHDGRKIRMLNIVDEFTREALAIRAARRLNSHDVIDLLSDLFILHGAPGYIRSDNGSEFIAKAVQEQITAVGAQTVYITPGSPWENGYIEASTRAYVMSSSTERFSTPWRRQKSSSKPGAASTIPLHYTHLSMLLNRIGCFGLEQVLWGA